MNVNRSKNNNINIVVNRLSGAYEAPLLESVQNLYMLEGNLFACRKSGEVKIKNDPYYDTAVTKCSYILSVRRSCHTGNVCIAPCLIYE